MSVIVHAYGGSSDSDRQAHEHAVMLASVSRSKLMSVHADMGELDDAPGRASDLLRRWGRDPGSVEHEKRTLESHGDPIDTVLTLLKTIEADLVVMATAQHKGVVRAILESRAEAIAAGLKIPALVIPTQSRGFVRDDGSIEISRILVPVGDEETAAAEIERTAWFVDLVRASNVTAELFHVANATSTPLPAELPEHPRIEWSRRESAGPLHETISEAATNADLIVMATRGHDSLLDWILGSHTERVLRQLDCPLLVLPIPENDDE